MRPPALGMRAPRAIAWFTLSALILAACRGSAPSDPPAIPNPDGSFDVAAGSDLIAPDVGGSDAAAPDDATAGGGVAGDVVTATETAAVADAIPVVEDTAPDATIAPWDAKGDCPDILDSGEAGVMGQDAEVDATVDEFAARALAWRQWSAFHATREDVYARRLAECLNLSEDLSHGLYEQLDYGWLTEIRVGIAGVDATAMSTCLSVLRTAACSQFILLAEDNAFRGEKRWRLDPFRACGDTIKGLVPTGGVALRQLECADDGDTIETSVSGLICASTCRKESVAALGGECRYARCPAGSTCLARPGNEPPICVANIEGAPCSESDFCGPGLFCEHAQDMKSGVCRPVRVGSPCQGSWQCPLTMACRADAPGEASTCRAGKAQGELCQRIGRDAFDVESSDCAYSLRCLSIDAGPPRCYSLSRPGEPCGLPPGVTSADWLMGCVPGSTCELDGKPRGVCVAPKLKAGESCTENAQCCRAPDQQNLSCVDILSEVEVGEHCGAGESDRECVFGAYCREDVPGMIPGTTTCRPYLKRGEACSDRDQCDFLLQCMGGVCRACDDL
jgi:hypothetical protein